jgi:hypothetical protein
MTRRQHPKKKPFAQRFDIFIAIGVKHVSAGGCPGFERPRFVETEKG